MKDVCIIGEAGGMRNSFSSGYLLGSGLKPQAITHAIGVSSGSLMLANFLSGQVEHSFKCWTEEMTRPEYCSFWNPWTRGRPIADIEMMVDDICKRMDIERVLETVKSFVVETVEMMTATPHFVTVNHGNFAPMLKASCALPLVANPVLHEGKSFIDGAMHDPLPVRHAYDQGHRKFLVLCNKPGNYVPEEYSALKRWIFFPESKPGREMLKGLSGRFFASREFLRHPPSDASIFLAMPPALLCETLERNRDTVAKSFETGFNLGRHDSAYLHEWLES